MCLTSGNSLTCKHTAKLEDGTKTYKSRDPRLWCGQIKIDNDAICSEIRWINVQSKATEEKVPAAAPHSPLEDFLKQCESNLQEHKVIKNVVNGLEM